MAAGRRQISVFDEEEDIRDPYAVAKGFGIAGGATLPKLFMERRHDMKLVNEYMKQNLASRGSPLLSKTQWANTYGSKLPNDLFQKASGTPGSLKGWLTGRTSPAHFAPVEKSLKFLKGMMPTIMNVGSKMAKFPNPITTVLQGLAPKALASGMLPEDVAPYTPFEQPTTPAYQPPVQPRVNNVSPGRGNSRRGPSYAQQAATVNRKAKSMGVASPIRRTPGTKYGFGL
jgi:hypothetical protein